MKLCPNCHSEIEDNAKFCTKCGTKLTVTTAHSTATAAKTAQAQGTAEDAQKNNANTHSDAAAINTQALQSAFQGYWSWLLASWKQPFKAQKTTKYAGILTLFLESLFFTLGIGHWAQTATSAASNAANNLLGSFSNNSASYNTSYSIGIGFYFTIILTILIAAVAMVGVAFLIHRAVSKAAEAENFIDYLNRLAHYSSSILLLTVLFFLIALSGMSIVSMLVISLILLLISAIWGITIVCGVVELENGGQLDRIYGAAITVAICVAIETIAFSLVISQLGDTAGSFVSSVFKGGGSK
nr:zinc ribbon domain-containing protein [Liquorilactobacillus satsumensis]